MTIKHYTIIELISSFFRHLRLSVSSVKFYQNIYLSYSGYGFQYLFIICFFSGLIFSGLFLNNANKINSYLKDNIFSSNVAIIDHILGQIPDLNYDGEAISFDEEAPLLISTPDNVQILAVDPENKLTPSERSKIPILMNNKNILISLFDNDGEVYKILPIKYNQIFGPDAQIITQSAIKTHFSNLLSRIPFIVIYLGFPLFVLVLFFKALMNQLFSVLFLYMISYFFSLKITFTTCFRMILFANGMVILLEPLIFITLPNLVGLVRLFDLWTGLLMCVAILGVHNKSFVL